MLATSAPAMPQETGRRDHYVGILLAYVEAINPTDAERIEMGVITQESIDSGKVKPVNYTEEDGRYRLDFWLKGKSEDGDEIRVRHSVFLKDEENRPANSGNIQVVNKQGKTAYIAEAAFAKGQSPYDWFSTPYHRAKIGESDLVQFINSWTNKKADSEAVPLDFAGICNGNLKPMQQVLRGSDASYVKVMLGIRTTDEGRRFQTVFPRVILPGWTVNYERLHKELGNYLSNSSARNDFGLTPNMAYDRNLYRLRTWDGEAGAAMPPVASYGSQPVAASYSQPAGQGPVRQPDLPVSSSHDDDLPF